MSTFKEPQENKLENTASLEGETGSLESREKKKTLAYLIETGRAKTNEEAERYLLSLNRLKERLVLFARELTLKQIHEPNSFPRDGMALYNSERAKESDLKKMTVKNITQENPNIWFLSRNISSSYPNFSGESYSHLKVKMDIWSVDIAFDMDGNAASKLKEQLSGEDLELLRREYAFAHKDLARQLRLEADRVSDKEIPEGGLDERTFGALFEKQEVFVDSPLQ